MSNKKKTDRERARELYLESNGTIALVDIAAKLDRPPGTVRGWKSKDSWDDHLNGTFHKKEERSKEKAERSTKKKSVSKSKAKRKKTKEPKMDLQILEELEDADLTDMQRLFCLHYLRTFNATQSAINAGYSVNSAYQIGHENLRKPEIKRELTRLKQAMASELYVDAMDILNQYAKIAFADITDFVEFGTQLVPVMASGQPIIITNQDTGKKEPLLKEVNVMRFKESFMVDGQLISSVKQGRDGASIQLIDKMKALEKLEQYRDVIPDDWKRKIDEEKLVIDKAKLELERLKITGDGAGNNREAIDDFIKATTVPVDEVADLFHDDLDDSETDAADDFEGDIDA